MKATSAISSVLFITVHACAFPQAPQPQYHPKTTTGLSVHTSSGIIDGHAASDATAVSEYLGIPFAEPPVGELRFAAPQKYNGGSVVNGTDFGFTCPSPPRTNNGKAALTTYGNFLVDQLLETDGYEFSEDCLTLNVWTKPDPRGAKKAVMIWIYGGSFTGGGTANPLYNGQYLADTEDVVIVTLNYRLNILGFPGNPAGTNNLGLLDVRLAIEWIQDNIGALGGDPARMTLFGQSAGGGLVDLYSFAYPSDPIVQGLIAESGVASGTKLKTLEEASVYWYQVADIVGCGNLTSNADDVLACMRTKDYNSLLTAIPMSTFIPSYDNVVVFDDYNARAIAGNFAQLPMLTGSNDNEEALFAAIADSPGQTVNLTSQVLGNLEFACAAQLRANISNAHGIPNWLYRYFGDFANTQLSPKLGAYPGAYHGAEISQIWNTTGAGSLHGTAASGVSRLQSIPVRSFVIIPKYFRTHERVFGGCGLHYLQKSPVNLSTEQYLQNCIVRGAWTTFAKDPDNGLTYYQDGWPEYNPLSASLIRLGYNNKNGTNRVLPALYDLTCGVLVAVAGA
ncbi:Cholinesterase [Lachnellula suecica]|uniref:Cholinesterase n=1 Tax=Lachnellula suecica TaxID=602035 RepID=A0A8T9C3K8_9HELO|nr:Cholinesterase [Lachnellula suecica]